MNKHPSPRIRPSAAGAARRPSSNGFSQVELLVVMGVLSLLLSLSLPAVSSVRGRAQQLHCLSNQRQLGLAISAHTERTGRYPAAGYFEAAGGEQYHSWVVSILPDVGEGALFQQYDRQAGHLSENNVAVAATPLPLLTCPVDVSLVSGAGNLSYVVNGGMAWTIPIDCPSAMHAQGATVTITPLDFNGNGVVCPLNDSDDFPHPDREHVKRLGMFFIENWPPGSGTVRYHRPEDVGDGMTHTILLAENVRAGVDPADRAGWAAPDPLRNMFFVSSYICPDFNCATDRVDISLANNRSHADARREAINSSLTQPEGAAPWPSSGHRGIVNVVYCDGHAKALNENIDGGVYFALVTPQGYGQDHPLSEPSPAGF